jgi:predicted TIM-barrel fold metal-dependent hydrolase
MASVELDIPRLIDAHHHLWDLSAGRYPWLQGPPEDPTDPTGVGMLQRDYLVPDLLEDAAGLPSIASVHVEAAYDPADPVAETRWLQKVSNETGFPHAIVANAFLERSDVENQLDQHAQAPNLRGIRQMLDRNPWTGASEETSLFSDPSWHHGLSLLAERHLVFDMQVLPSQLREAARAAVDHPDVVFALNHGGYHVPYSEEAERLWRQGIAEIGQCPNVVVKASGYETVDPAWPQEGLDRYVEALLDAFDTDRVLFASNFPVDRRTISYRRLVEMNRIATRNLDDEDRDRFFFANAQRVYSVRTEH